MTKYQKIWYKRVVAIKKNYKLYTYENYDEDEFFVKSLSSMSEVVSLNNVFRSTDFGSSICDVPIIIIKKKIVKVNKKKKKWVLNKKIHYVINVTYISYRLVP